VNIPDFDGVPAAALQLPKGEWATVLDCLCAHFAAITREQWRSRFERGLILNAEGRPMSATSPYRPGIRVHYYREVPDETPIPFTEDIIHADERLIVVDKPHFLPVSPVGAYVRETLLSRLQRRFGNAELVPLHRLDRGTAGLVMFSVERSSRDAYQALFRERRIHKRYEAIAPALTNESFPLVRRTRLVRGEPFVRTREIIGEANSETRIEVIDAGGDFWRYDLQPLTGKKHQLRVHMAALGAPIVNDDLYPQMSRRAADDFSHPLQLLARSLEFVDPLSGVERQFASRLAL